MCYIKSRDKTMVKKDVKVEITVRVDADRKIGDVTSFLRECLEDKDWDVRRANKTGVKKVPEKRYKFQKINGVKFYIDRKNEVSVGMSGYRGAVDIAYKKLVEVFGEPEPCDGKMDAHWTLLFPDKAIATIYNYKDGKNYLGSEGTATSRLRDWHIGGHRGNNVVNRVAKILGVKPSESEGDQ
jgi:hypothetical protein